MFKKQFLELDFGVEMLIQPYIIWELLPLVV